ncbi:MAG: hypothetical protein ACOZE5_00500 [Verrucomicrobiota bacterium]
MKKTACIVVLLTAFLSLAAQDAKPPEAKTPKENVISSYRIFAKAGQNEALKAALGAHAKKYHTGAFRWRVYSVLSGPDSGAYQIVEGPFSWTAFDDRGDLAPDHNKHYETSIAPLVEKTTADAFLSYEEELSTVALTAFSTKASITTVYPKPGRGPAIRETLKTWKKVWEKRGFHVAVYAAQMSGEPQFKIVRRLKAGWKDLDADVLSQSQAFTELGLSHTELLEDMAKNTDRSHSEMIEMKPDLGSS